MSFEFLSAMGGAADQGGRFCLNEFFNLRTVESTDDKKWEYGLYADIALYHDYASGFDLMDATGGGGLFGRFNPIEKLGINISLDTGHRTYGGINDFATRFAERTGVSTSVTIIDAPNPLVWSAEVFGTLGSPLRTDREGATPARFEASGNIKTELMFGLPVSVGYYSKWLFVTGTSFETGVGTYMPGNNTYFTALAFVGMLYLGND